MLVDLTLRVDGRALQDVSKKRASFGHYGTHIDIGDKQFPLAYVKRAGVVFEVTDVKNRDINANDIDLFKVRKDMFVAFCTGYSDEQEYGTDPYFAGHPQLSDELIDQLLEREISLIGVDFAGIRRGQEHAAKDRYCADRGVFIVENLCNLHYLLKGKKQNYFMANTFPVNFSGLTGLPCRVVGEI